MSRPRAKRYLGMTIPQLGVLGVLGLCICSIFAGGFWWLNSMVAAAYESPLPGPDVTPLPTSTPPSTETPFPTPSPTPITYESLIPADWKQFTSVIVPGMEIWLPPSFAPLTEKDKAQSLSIYDVEAARTALELKDSTPSAYMVFTSFEISIRPIFAASLDEMIDQEFGTLMRTGSLLERDPFVFETETHPAHRLIFDVDVSVSGADAGVVIYVVQVGADLWYLSFATPFNELYARLPVFDQVAQTFRIVTP